MFFLLSCNKFLSDKPKQAVCLSPIFLHTIHCQLLCQFYLQTLHKHLTCLVLHLNLTRLRNFCELERFRKVINCIYKIKFWLSKKKFFELESDANKKMHYLDTRYSKSLILNASGYR